MGSSLVVQPANTLPAICLANDVPVILINQTPTKYDEYVDLAISEPCGDFIGEVLSHLSAGR
jgi:NAD-dependent SIR2 family protein deacetylase